MFRAMLRSAEGIHTEGDEQLVSQWRGSPGSRLWLDIQGELTDDIRQLLQDMGCDDLAIADCFRTRHPPKIEHFSQNTFLLLRGISSIDDNLVLEPQQIGLWIGENYLITVHRGSSVSVSHFWESDPETHLLAEPNLLALQLFHYACGRYLEKLLNFEDRLADLEDLLLSGESDAEMKELVIYRSQLRKLRRIFNYHKGVAENILETGSAHLGQGNDASRHVRRDVYDRCERLYSLCNMYYELCGDLVEGYISMSSHKLNNTMKVLTIITAIFVPMSFLAGLYGMNFEYMPELGFKYAYFILLGVMGSVAAGMIALFRHMRWL